MKAEVSAFNGREPDEHRADVDLAALVESTLTVADRHAWFGRLDIVQKPAHDLPAHEWIDRVFTVGRLQAGYVPAR